jgi:hypothetical protein
MQLSRQDQVWNRACLESGGPSPLEGDEALASLLLAHGLAMNGGVVHALESMSRCEIRAAIAGYTYFGLTQAAEVFKQVPDESEETEEHLNRMYWVAVPSDETLAHAFRVKLLSTPEAFAPTAPGAHG